MAEKETRETVAPEAISVTNVSPDGHRGFHDAAGALVMLKPGEDIANVQVPGPLAADMRQWSADGTSDLVVAGAEPAAARKEEKQLTREELNKAEKDERDAGLKASGSKKPGEAPPSAKLSRGDMDGMTKAELTEHAASIGVDVPASASKQEAIDAIVKGQRK